MSTFYVNAAGSNTSPFDTPVKGATTFKSLYDSSLVQIGDTVKVLNNGVIDDRNGGNPWVFVMPASVTIEAYDPVNKPTIYFTCTESLGDYHAFFELDNACKIRNLKLIIYNNSGNNNSTIILNKTSGLYEDIEVSGCWLTGHRTLWLCRGANLNNVKIFNNVFLYDLSCQSYLFLFPGYMTNTTVYNNTFCSATGYHGDLYGVYVSGVTDSFFVRNNLFTYVSREVIVLTDGTPSTSQYDYNGFYNCSGSRYGVLPNPPNEVVADPLYVNESGSDFHIQSGSPMKDAGTSGVGYPTTDYDGTSRPYGPAYDIGAYEYAPWVPTPLSFFSGSSIADENTVTSYVTQSKVVSAIQSYIPDSYFDSTSELYKVTVYYAHEDGRQVKKVIHKRDGTNMVGTVSWSSGARDGTWQKTALKCYDSNGAVRALPRSQIGSSEDLVHSDGTMTLNV